MIKTGKAPVGGTYVNIFISFMIYHFSMKTKRQKGFSRVEPMAELKKKWEFEIFCQFFFFSASIVDIER